MSRFRFMMAGDTLSFTLNREKDPFQYVSALRSQCAAAFCNLEAPLAEAAQPARHPVIPLGNIPGQFRFLKESGRFTAVTVANNHIADYGRPGLLQTLEALDKAGIAHTGAASTPEAALEPAMMAIQGVKIAFVGLSYSASAPCPGVHTALLDSSHAAKAIKRARDIGAHIVICSPHWGLEYAAYPTPNQQALGRALIDLGADIVAGHHPHIIQGVEQYKNKPIYYSLGNFNMTDDWSRRPKFGQYGAVLLIDTENSKITRHEIVPIKINEHYQPCLVPETTHQRFMQILATLSEPLARGITWPYWLRSCGRTAYNARVAAWRMGMPRRTARSECWRVRLRCAADLLHPLRLAWWACSLALSALSPNAAFRLPEDL